MPRWPDKTISSSEQYSAGEGEVPVKTKSRVRVPGTIFEVDEDGIVHVPAQLLEVLFQKTRSY